MKLLNLLLSKAKLIGAGILAVLVSGLAIWSKLRTRKINKLERQVTNDAIERGSRAKVNKAVEEVRKKEAAEVKDAEVNPDYSHFE